VAAVEAEAVVVIQMTPTPGVLVEVGRFIDIFTGIE